MSEAKDDPREVLQMLNSLGFVGITAQQLKDFMKGKHKQKQPLSLVHIKLSVFFFV